MLRMCTQGFEVLHEAEELAFRSSHPAVGTLDLLCAILFVANEDARVDLDQLVDVSDAWRKHGEAGLGVETFEHRDIDELRRTAAASFSGSSREPGAAIIRMWIEGAGRPALKMTKEAAHVLVGTARETDGEGCVGHILLALLHGQGEAASWLRAANGDGTLERRLQEFASRT